MMDLNNIIISIISVLVGAFSSHILYKIKNLQDKIKQIEENILSPEEMAKEVLKIKMPLSKVPPEFFKNLSNKKEELKSYVG